MKTGGKRLGALGKQLAIILILSLFNYHSYSQCTAIETTFEVCDMATIDSDIDGTPDGIVNLYDVTGTSLADGIWSTALNNAIVIDQTNGDLYTWELRNSSEDVADYIFNLTSPTCPDPLRIVNIVLGPYSGMAPPPDPDDINYYMCSSDILDLSTVLVSNETTPAAHINGTWNLVSNPTGSAILAENQFAAAVAYQPGLPRIDQDIYELTYTVPGILPCAPSAITNVKIAVVRQVFAGAPAEVLICESEVIAGDYDADIDVRDDPYLVGEDIEGFWDAEFAGNGNSLIINIKDLYNDLTNNGANPRFGCETFSYTYTVERRSVVCIDDQSTVTFTVYEELRPFQQNVFPEECRLKVDDPTQTINLFDLIQFTDGFIYNDDTYTHWEFLSGPSDLGLVVKRQSNPSNPVELTCIADPAISDPNLEAPYYDADAPVTINGVQAGEYRFKYIVCPDINGCPNADHPCPRLETEVVLIILPEDYAGENTSGLKLCESQEEVDLRSLLNTNGIDTVVNTGTWRNEAGEIIDNTFVFPDIENDQTFAFSYTTELAGCIDSTNLTFTINKLPNAGENGEATVCSDNLTVTLFDQLGGAPDTTGTWFGPNGYTSTDHLGVFDASDNTLPILGEGEFIYIVPARESCLDEDRASVIITIIEPVEIGNDVNETFCKLDGRVNLFSLLDRDTVLTGVFEDTDGTGALTSDGVLEFETLTNEIYNFRYIVTNTAPCDESSLNVAIQIIELPIPNVPSQEFCILDAKRLEDIEVDVLNFNWYNTLESETPIVNNPLLFDNDIYYIANIDVNNCESERLPVLIDILNTGERFSNRDLCTLDFQDGVSPNGDNQNDTFDLLIEGVYNIPEAFPDFDLKIYNRYGSLVYEGRRDTNEFRGESNISVRLGDDLPSGTYFYIFNPNFENNLPIQGSFYLSR